MLNTCEKDSFYKQHTPEELELAFANKYDFDHPDALDMTLFASVGVPLRWDNTIIKQYHPIVHCRPQERASNKHSGILFFSAPTTEGETVPLRSVYYHWWEYPLPFIWHWAGCSSYREAEGIMTLQDPALRQLYDLKVGDLNMPLPKIFVFMLFNCPDLCESRLRSDVSKANKSRREGAWTWRRWYIGAVSL